LAKSADAGPMKRFLGLLASMVGTAIGKASTLLGKFVQGVGKVFSWIPGLNRLTNPLFEGLGKILTSFGEKMSLFASNFKLLEKGAVKELDDLVTADTFRRITPDGKFVEFVGKDAKVTRFPADDVAKAYRMTNPKNGKLFTTGAEWVKYHKAVAKPAVKAAFKDRFLAFFMTRFNKEAAENFSKRMPYFVGKQIYKLIFGSDFIDGKSKWTRAEVEGHGNGAFNDFLRRRIEEEKAKRGADFIPSLNLDASDKEAFDKITEYQNNYAQLNGQPSIMHVVYDKADNNAEAKEFKSFFDKVAAGEIKRGDAGDIVRTQTSTDVRNIEKKKNESRTVLSFKDFKNV
jgi:hypothetical protein